MNHLTDEQLILHYYGERPEPGVMTPEPVETHLEDCSECRERFGYLQRTLNTLSALPVPERGPLYSQAVWGKLQAQMPALRKKRWVAFPRWALAGALSALVLMAFLAGRWTGNTERVEVAKTGTPVRERLLLVALGDHLERSQRVLVELSNVGPGALGETRDEAQDLLASNRLFRQAALRQREAGVASVLDELELLLTDVSHASEGDWEEIRERMADQGILFKVRVIESNVRQREKDDLPVVRY